MKVAPKYVTLKLWLNIGTISILLLVGCKDNTAPVEPLACEISVEELVGGDQVTYDLIIEKDFGNTFRGRGYTDFKLTNNGIDSFTKPLKVHGSYVYQTDDFIEVRDSLIIRNLANPRHPDFIDFFYLNFKKYPDNTYTVFRQEYSGSSLLAHELKENLDMIPDEVKSRLEKIENLILQVPCKEEKTFDFFR